jgi:hypothetical protein
MKVIASLDLHLWVQGEEKPSRFAKTEELKIASSSRQRRGSSQ